MKITKVCCQGCGADLDIDETIRFVTCNYCHSRLEVIHDETITHTKRLEQVERKTDDMAKQLNVIQLQNDIEHLDREWGKFRESALSRDDQGNFQEPSTAVAIIGGVVGIIAGIVFIILSIANASPIIAFPSLAFIGLAIFGMARGRMKAEEYRIQRYRYETARKSIFHRLEAARKS